MNLAEKLSNLDEPKLLPLEGKALVLDFGSVVSRSIFEKRFEVAIKLGLEKNAINWPGPMEPESDPLWTDMLADKLTEREYWAAMAKAVGKLVGEEWTPLDYLNAARHDDINLDIRPEIVHLVSIAKSGGAKIGVLSNELELFYGKEAMDSVHILKDVDAMVDATHTKILKPDPRAYAEILERLDIPSDKAIFLDDQPRNVKGSNDFGMKALFFDVRDPKGVCEEAWKLLVEL